MGSTKFSLCWSDYESNLVGGFRSLLQSNSLVDCTIAAEGQHVKVHRIILSATSSYFQRLFEEDSDKHPIVFLKDVKFQLLMSILDFIYSGKVQVSEDQLEEFLVTAQSLQINGLSSDKFDYVKKELSDLHSAEKEYDNDDDDDDDPHASPKAIDSNDMNAFDACELLPVSDEENPINSNSNASSSLDHQYCADNGDMGGHPSFLVVSAVSTNSEASSSASEELTDFDNSKIKTSICGQSGAFRMGKNIVDTKQIVKWNDSNQIFLKLKRKPPSQVNKVCVERDKNNSERSTMKTVLSSPQLNKISQKPGTIVISKPVGIYSAVPIHKQKVVSPCQKRQAFIIGSKVLAVPRGAILSGTKEWLQPPKPHLEGKLHPCPECNKAFRKPSILANHRRTHTGEKPYQCQECGRMFNQSSNFRRHQRTHAEQRLRSS